jgi:DNA-binding NarL/FixJ family response regulator
MPAGKKTIKEKNMISVAILEDNEPMLKGMCIELDKPDIRICSARDELEAFLEDVRQYQPAIAVVDLRIRTTDTEVGYDAIRAIREVSPQTHCIIYTVYDTLEHFHKGVNLGVKAFVSKHIHGVSLEKVIRIVANGGTFYGDLLSQYLEKVKEMPPVADVNNLFDLPQSALSERELEILSLFGNGKTEEEIAAELHVTKNTIKAHTKNIRGKMNVKTTIDAVRFGRLRGLL